MGERAQTVPGGSGRAPTVLVDQLVARYGDREILSGVSLRVEPGEVRVILGGSGSGKSTLLKNIIGLERPAGGTVSLLGVDQASADEPTWQGVLRRIGVLFQNGALLNSLTVHENIALPILERVPDMPAKVVDEMVMMKLALVGLEHAAALTPPELSGGMKKRAALARAMALDPEVLFCDEPSAGLDPITAADLDALILALRDRFGMSVVVVTHELASIHAIADKVIMLAQGHALADGTLADLEASSEPRVRDFFARRGKAALSAAGTVLGSLESTGEAR